MSINAVIFDIGNVLVRWDPLRMYDETIGEARRKSLFAAVDLDTMNERVDLGEDIAEVVAETAAAHPEHGDAILLWHRRWLDMLRPEIPATARILRALRRRGVPVMALSNFGTTTLELADKTYPVLTEFDRRFISGHLGMMKPDPAIYTLVEQETGLAPETLFFTDDRPDNIEAAALRGWQTHLFTAPETLADRLLRDGLLNAEDLE